MALTFLRLPINADEGFPQTFRMQFAGNLYTLLLYVNIAEEALQSADDGALFSLPAPGAFLVMQVAREAGGVPAVIFQRKIVPGLQYSAQELAFVFSEITVAKGNLNGVGALGSRVEGSVASQ